MKKLISLAGVMALLWQPWALWLLPASSTAAAVLPTALLRALCCRFQYQAAAAGCAQGREADHVGRRRGSDHAARNGNAFIEQNADKGNVTIEIWRQSEFSAKDTVLADPKSAADVFAFADDQLNELVQAGALQEVQLNPDDMKSRNLPASVDAATMNDKLYAYPMTADNGYFLYYDASVLSAEDVQSVDTMLEKAAAAGKKFMMSCERCMVHLQLLRRCRSGGYAGR